MATSTASKKAPSFVTRLNPIVNRMLGIGFPMGPNGLITVRGRTSGEPRTTPVAFVDIDDAASTALVKKIGAAGRKHVPGISGDRMPPRRRFVHPLY